MADVLDRIDRAWLRAHALQELVAHLNMGHEHHSTYRILDRRTAAPIGLTCSKSSYKRVKRNGDKAGTVVRTYYVATHPEPISRLDEALEILAIVRQAGEASNG